MNYLQAFESSWPEDEAYGLWQDMKEGEFTAAEIMVHTARTIRMFKSEPDADALIARFNAKLATLRAGESA